MRQDDRYKFRKDISRAGGAPDKFTDFLRHLIEARPNVGGLGPSQTQLLDGLRLDAILHMEHLEDEFRALPFWNGHPDKWPHLNATAPDRRPWQHYVTPEAAALVEEWAGNDIARFGYRRQTERV